MVQNYYFIYNNNKYAYGTINSPLFRPSRRAGLRLIMLTASVSDTPTSSAVLSKTGAVAILPAKAVRSRSLQTPSSSTYSTPFMTPSVSCVPVSERQSLVSTVRSTPLILRIMRIRSSGRCLPSAISSTNSSSRKKAVSITPRRRKPWSRVTVEVQE